MRELKQLCTATMLLLALAFTAFAGDIHTPGIISPPPDQPSITGDMHTGLTASETSNSETTAIDSVMGLALYLFNGITSSF